MKVVTYRFGYIKANGFESKTDAIIGWSGVINPRWFRREVHRLTLADTDFSSIMQVDPQVIVIGTGYYGKMYVDRSVIAEFVRRGLDVYVQNSIDAVKTFNKFIDMGKKAVLMIHLTC